MCHIKTRTLNQALHFLVEGPVIQALTWQNSGGPKLENPAFQRPWNPSGKFQIIKTGFFKKKKKIVFL